MAAYVLRNTVLIDSPKQVLGTIRASIVMSSGSASQNEILNQYFETLKSKIPEVREAGARDLRRYVGFNKS